MKKKLALNQAQTSVMAFRIIIHPLRVICPSRNDDSLSIFKKYVYLLLSLTRMSSSYPNPIDATPAFTGWATNSMTSSLLLLLFIYVYYSFFSAYLFAVRILGCSDYLFKLLLIGDSSVGKSCLLLRFAVIHLFFLFNFLFFFWLVLFFSFVQFWIFWL